MMPPPDFVDATTHQLIDSILRTGAEVRFAVPTQSMTPVIEAGDWITARALGMNEPLIGDIVVIRSGEKWLAHRLIESRVANGRVYWVTKGDNCTAPDDLWSAEQICAMITMVEHNGRKGNFESRRAKIAGVLVAYLSRLQLRFARQHPRIQQLCSGLARASVWMARWVVGLQ